MWTQPVIEPIGESRSDVEIILALAERLQLDDPMLAQGHEAAMNWRRNPHHGSIRELNGTDGWINTLIKTIMLGNPKGMPDMYFFRHLAVRSGTKAGEKFGERLLRKYWQKACDNLGVEGVPLYPGSKHSTVTGLGKYMSPEAIQNDVTGHLSDAFQEYSQPDVARQIKGSKTIVKMRKEARRGLDKKEKKVLKLKKKA